MFVVGLLRFDLDMSIGKFVALVLPALAFELIHDLLARPLIRRVTAPIVA